MRKQERTRRAECGDPASHASLDEHLAWLDAAVARLDREIGDAVKASPALDQSVTLLRSAPGVDPVTATVLTAAVLIAAVLIAAVLIAAVLIAAMPELGRHPQGRLGASHQSLRQAGEPPKVAFIALARKLLTILSAVTRDKIAFTA